VPAWTFSITGVGAGFLLMLISAVTNIYTADLLIWQVGTQALGGVPLTAMSYNYKSESATALWQLPWLLSRHT
jgi:hypothetical protein